MFQVVFCATAATIVSGAMAERTKFSGYLIYSVIISAVVYPVFGSWAWGSLFNGSGWLEGLGFIDFAGSTVVHSVGGWAALAGTLVLGPRLGKYTKNGKIKPILGHNLPLAALGVFILWLGWFGFNPGSTTAASTDIDMIFVNTNLAAAAGAVVAMYTSWIKFGKPEVGMSLNGALAGLVAITACFLWVFPVAFVMFKLIDKTVGLRVSPEEEMEGLDFTEHAGNAYPDFEVSTYRGFGASSSGGGNGYSEAPSGIISTEPLKSTS